ncbi:MAG: LamG-like jellyroll fold domain-containing protein, partial [Thalassobaculaceae bacterium]
WTGDTGSYAITSGGVDNTAGDDSIKSNWTSGTGDFTIQFTATGVSGQTWGFYPVTEDGTFASNDSGGMTSMSGSYWFTGNSTNVNKMQYGAFSTSRAISSDIVAGDVVKYTRISGEVKVYVNASLVYTYPETSNADMRVAFANHGTTTGDIDSLTFSVTSTTTNATGTLISDAQTASSSRTSCSGVIIYSDASGTATLGTDLKIYFTCNNGTNWTEASSYGTATTYSGTKKLVKLGATTCTAGTQVAMKAVWANQQSSSGTEKTITAVGDAQHATDQYKIGSSSAKFDGTGDALRIAGNLPAITGTGSFTAECWFRLNGSGTGYQRILNYGDSAGGSELINVDFYRPSSTLRCHASTSGSSRNIFSQTTTSSGISDTTWHHLAYVRNGTSFKVYIDGSEKVSGTSSSSIGTGTGFAFGGYYNDGGSSTEYFYGHIDEMRISSVARYTGAFTPSTSAFTADTDTVLLIHSDTSNGSTTFADSSVVAGKESRLEGWAVNY